MSSVDSNNASTTDSSAGLLSDSGRKSSVSTLHTSDLSTEPSVVDSSDDGSVYEKNDNHIVVFPFLHEWNQITELMDDFFKNKITATAAIAKLLILRNAVGYDIPTVDFHKQ